MSTLLQAREQSINKNPCGVCQGMKLPPPCKGHGVEAGGVEGDSELSKNIEISPPQLKPDLLFIHKILSSLLQDGRLVFTHDEEFAKLSIECDARLLNTDEEDAVDAYANLILHELDEFKKNYQLEKPCYQLELDNKGHLKSLIISMPTRDLYDKFIQQLKENMLIPDENKPWKPPTPSPFKG